MKNLKAASIQKLASAKGDALVSIYAPMQRAGREVRQNEIRWKNILKNARQKLSVRGIGDTEIEQVLAAATEKLDDDEFWQHQSDGLAFFLGNGFSESYQLPIDFEQQIEVGKHFLITPLMQAENSDYEYYLLAASPNRVRLFHNLKHVMCEVQPDDFPENLRDALNIDEYVSALQFHSTSYNAGSKGNAAAIHHGHGGSDPDVKKTDELLQFFHRLDDSLQQYFGVEDVPLIFAGVEYLFPIFKKACHYRNLVAELVKGNPDELSADELRAKAHPIVEEAIEDRRWQTIAKYNDKAHTDWASSDPVEILRSAEMGQVDTLLIAESYTCRAHRGDDGQFQICTKIKVNEDTANQEIESFDLINLTVVETIKNGGTVLLVPAKELPKDTQIAAVFRSPVSRYLNSDSPQNVN